MSQFTSLDKIIFIDIETVPILESYQLLHPHMQELWNKKAQRMKDESTSDEDYFFQHAGIFAEFGKIICISFGIFENNTFNIQSIVGDDEKTLLLELVQVLRNHKKRNILCGHNIKEFDIPYLCRRMIVNEVELPAILDVQGMKPWEVNHIDTMQMWKFGDYKHFTSLDLLTHILQIPSPKNDIDGSMVCKIYYVEKDLERIKKYCQNDVLAVTNVYLKFQNKALLDDRQIVFS